MSSVLHLLRRSRADARVCQPCLCERLYGSLNQATREWREGLVSVTFRDMANNRTNKHQWIVLDGDIDAEWIEVTA